MSEKANGSGWTRGKILALVILICLAVVAVAVTLTLVLGKNGGTTQPSTSVPTGKVPTDAKVTEEYQKIKQEAEAAVKELEDLESQEAAADAALYEQELEQAEAAITQLEGDVQAATSAVQQVSAEVSTASSAVTETAEAYEQLLTEIEAYYAYVESVLQQAVTQVDYLKSVAPTLQEFQQWQSLIARAGQAPEGVQQRQLTGQLASGARQALSKLQSSKISAPDALISYSESIDSLAGQLEGISQQMIEALSTGNTAQFDALANQVDASLGQTQQQLTQGLNSVFSSFESGLASAGQKVDASLPQK